MSVYAALFWVVRACAWGGFLVLAWRISTKDLRNQRIEHRDLSAGAFLALAAYLALGINSLAGAWGASGSYLRGRFFLELAAHAAFTITAGVGLWAGAIWPAGDAKLYILLSLLLPLLAREPGFHDGRLFLHVLINIFLPACLFVFLQVLSFLWHTRLKHAAGFMRQMGLHRAWGVGLAALRESIETLSRQTVQTLRGLRERPADGVFSVLRFGASFVLMAGVSAALRGVVESGTARTALSFLCLFGLVRAQEAWGSTVVWIGAAVTGGAYFLMPAASTFRGDLLMALRAVSIFSVFVMFGAQWTLGFLGGRPHWAVLPLLGSVFGLAWGAACALFSQARWAFGLLSPYMALAGLGTFFGLCHVFVKIWEEEDRPEIPLGNLVAYMVPHPAFLDMIQRTDPDFHESHLSTVYADGLTPEQLKLVRAWCKRHGVPSMTLQTTMAFAPWIFLGYFLTWLLDGHVLGLLL